MVFSALLHAGVRRRGGLLAFAALVATLLAPGPMAEGAAPVLTEPTPGHEVVQSHPDRLDDIARVNQMDEARVRHVLTSDDAAWVASDGRVYFAEEPPPRVEEAGGIAMPYPSSETFFLHSRPGSSKVIYLDFDGHTINGPNGWLSVFTGVTSPLALPWVNSQGNFTEEQLEFIQRVWQRVAEDYAPFDVDVTTQDPGNAAIDRSSAADTAYGTRVVITPSSLQTQCACGGTAFLGAFDAVQPTAPNPHASYQPVIVFSRIFSNGPAYDVSSKSVAESVSHEVGHTLGLIHDGTTGAEYYSGHGSWAPIMGTGYTRPIVQFSRGEYAGANNPQDDFAVIQGHGLTLVADEAGGSPATAASLGSVDLMSADGTISSRTDVDVYRFTGFLGPYTIRVGTRFDSPNLDVRLELLDADGAVIDAADPASGTLSAPSTAFGMSAEINGTLPRSGTYYVRISGAGTGDPATTGYSSYGSVGSYRLFMMQSVGYLRLTTSPPVPAVITIDGRPADQWGLNWVKLPATGSHNVCFGDVPGHTAPACLSIGVKSGEVMTVTAEYRVNGTLRVITSPPVPATVAFQFPMDDWGAWTDVPFTGGSVCFGAVEGYYPPPCQYISVPPGSEVTVTGTYIDWPSARGETGKGRLRVTTDPPVPSRITVDERLRNRWALNGLKLEPGPHQLCFSPVPGFLTPPCQTVDLVDGQTTTVLGRFTPAGSLRVITSPPVPSTIIIDGYPRNDWGLWTEFPIGPHTVCFGEVPGRRAPACQNVNVVAGQTAIVTGVFS